MPQSCSVLGLLIMSSVHLAVAQLPVELELHHHSVFQNSAVRVLDVKLQPGETSLEHLHSHDVALICLSGSARTRPAGGDWGASPEPCKPGTSRIMEYTASPVTHTIQNAGSTPYRLIAVENLRQRGWSTYAPADGLKVTMESKGFRIYQLMVPHDAEIVHTHKVPTVAILISGELVAGDDPEKSEGHCIFIPAWEPHKLATTHAQHAQVVEIEIR